MSINVFHLLETVLSEQVVKSLGARYGLTPELTRKISGAAAPAIMAAIMHRGTTPEGARSLFSTIMSPEVNAQIGKQLPDLLTSTAGLSQLEATGRELVQKATGANVGALSDAVAAQTGTPQSTAFSLAGVVGAAMMGILKHHFTASQGFVGQLPTLLGHQLSSVNASLTDRLAGAVGLGSAAAFAGSILSRLKDVSAHLDHPQPVVRPVPASVPPQTVGMSTPPIVEEKRRHHWLWWLLAALALIIAFFALRSCQHDEQAAPEAAASAPPAAVAASDAASDAAAQSAAQAASQANSASAAVAASGTVASGAVAAVAASDAAPAPTQDSHLSFTVDKSGVPTITATVGTEAEKQQLMDALTKKFGAGKFTANVNVDAATKPAEWLAHLDGLLPLMALPGAEVKIDGTHVELSGAAADAKAGWLDKLKALFGSGFDIGVFNVQKAVADATQSFRDAVKGLFATDASCAGADVAKVLNLQVVNFKTGSSIVPASAADDLRQSARALIACSKRGQPVSLEVAGYSDNVGDKAANLALSKQRALAVRTYLASQGVPLSRLTAQGYGDVNPVESNDTESGRFHNRRIEFIAKQ
ncbi:OmpA family protein [Paraburkholderia unamae]|uniref:Outer membrane protein OmpA-like peptidoglycan-associated protein n=1 Tax=Paraburkholderia unamae TaxID=219649 RepID=A0ABX5KZV5_9BURK|nr:OmpA family protein [Paraburkholderia unamae]PVX97355.1 outer membrane protein OmpA-like peptidoglycan-associated protein [Paraburkholderia unamae]